MVNLTNLLMLADTGHFIGNWLYDLSASIGNFGWTVVAFTVILKLVTSPFDIWQKSVMRKNNRAMKRMQPKLEKLQKQYANNQQVLAEKQMQLYKEEKFSTFGACLPMILTMVIFFVVFAGFNATVRYQNQEVFETLQATYKEATIELENDANFPTKAEKQAEVEKRVLNKYESDIRSMQSFLWIENIFVADTWAKPIPNWDSFVGTGMGNMNANIEGLEEKEYTAVMKPIMEKYNSERGGWNGFMVLPLLSFVLNFVTSKLMSSSQQMPAGNDEMQKSQQMSMKMMQWMMPLMMLVFGFIYSSAFTLYMFVSALVSTIFQVATNLVFKFIDKKEEEKTLTTSYK